MAPRATWKGKAPERGKVINLMDALRQSLEKGAERKPPARSRRQAAAEKSGTQERSRKTSGGG